MSDEHLIEAARTRRPRRPSRRDLLTSGALGGAFLVTATTLAVLLPGHRPLSWVLMLALVGGYAVLSRVEFEVGPGSAVPIQLVFVPMLFALPVTVVPLCVAAGYVLGALPDYLTRRVHPARVLVLLSSSWYAIGPAVVLSLAPSDEPAVGHAPVYLAALVAQFGLDFASSAIRQGIVFGNGTAALLPSFRWVWGVDSLLAPIGLVAALSGAAGAMVIGPFVVLLALIARDRRARIDRAVTAHEAYRDALDDAYRDDLSGIANRRRLLHDLELVAASPASGHVLVLYDLNGFKQYNDTFGHPAGDVMLRRLAGKLACAVDPQVGAAYRLGGDEFCVLASAPTRDLRQLLDATMDALREEGDGFSISACFGSVFIPFEAADPLAALTIADQRLYAQKRAATQRHVPPRLVLLDAESEAAGAA